MPPKPVGLLLPLLLPTDGFPMNGNLIVTPAKDGSALYWEGSWRSNGKAVKRRIGKAHVVPRAKPLEGNGLASWQRAYVVPRSSPPAGCLTAIQAQAKLSEMIAAHAATAQGDRSLDRFGALADAWLIERGHDVADGTLKPSTMRDYKGMLSRKTDATMPRGKARTAWLMSEWETTKVATIDVDAVEAFEAKLRAAGLSARTRRKYTVLLSMLLDFAVRRKVATINVLAARGRQRNGRKQTKDVAVYSLAVVEQIAAACADEQIGNIIRLAALTGCRQGELLSLRWRDVRWQQSSLHVRSTIAQKGAATIGKADKEPATIADPLPKSGKSRSVPLAQQAIDVLEDIQQRDKWTDASDLVFGHERGDERRGKAKTWSQIDASHVRKAYKAARDKVVAESGRNGGTEPLPALRFHDLRHTFGSQLASAGVPLTDIQAYMGHSSVATTQIYVHFQPRHDAAERLTAVFASKADKPSVIRLHGKR
jgi:integrase